jgi:hypothetical protein
MPEHHCPYPNCGFKTKDISDELAAVMLKIHADGMHTANQQKPTKTKVESVRRPIIASGGTSEEWSYFLTRWSDYKTATNISGTEQIIQLLECCEEDLRKDITRAAGGSLTTKSEDDVLRWMKMLAVRQENIMVARKDLYEMQQRSDEAIRSFGARVKGQASVCKYTLECPGCNIEVNYTNKMLRDVIVRGIVDKEIQLDLLSDRNQEMPLEEVMRYVEAKEAGKRSANKILQTNHGDGANSSSIKSQYQKSRSANQTREGKLCSYCGKSGHGKALNERKKLCPAYGKTCSHCGIPNHLTIMCRLKAQGFVKPKETPSSIQHNFIASECPIWEELCDMHNGSESDRRLNQSSLSHHVYRKQANKWIKQPSQPQPSVSLLATVDKEDYYHLGFTEPARPFTIKVDAMPDTGCQSCLAGLRFTLRLGIPRANLIPVNLRMSAANKTTINILGAAVVRFTGQSYNGRQLATRQIVYITDATDKVYLSKEACTELGIISRKFPMIGEAGAINGNDTPNSVGGSATNMQGNSGHEDVGGTVVNQTGMQSTKCDCPRRSLPPRKPHQLPFSVRCDNDVDRLKQWLLTHYSSSTFNTCTHQTLPKMSGPPLRLMIEDSATPVAHHTPIKVPIHWTEAVKEGLDQDVRLGVIQPVPVGDPVTWCHQMVVCAKKNGKPRRTVDFQALNKFAKRETHHTQSPYIQARSIPSGKLKSVFDCWNGYHSIPLHKDDYHLTTFITPWGRYQYKVAPQGYMASGDGYCRRFDEIVSDIPNKTKCVDDTLLWADTIEESFFQAVNWLDICGRNGIVLNPEKFVFAQSTADFAGFTVTNDCVRPSSKYLSAIKDFPTPGNLTDIRSWFGLVNQVAYTFAAAEIMNPFRELLKSNSKFYWNEQLEDIFQRSKVEILKKIEHGVKIYDKSKPTCLATDWSKTGLGYWLLQKHCECTPTKPFCCRNGWKVALVGSRFTHTAESRYAPVEGEALAVVYALNHARYFVLGCEDLIIAVDHKPLLSFFEKRSMDIANNRLRNLKEKTLRYRFRMVYISGVKHKATDAISRKPSGSINPPMMTLPDDVDTSMIKDDLNAFKVFLSALRVENKSKSMIEDLSIATNALDSIQVVTWEKVKQVTSTDPDMESLLSFIQSGFPSCKSELSFKVQQYFRHRKHLKAVDGVVLYKNRIVIPESLRQTVLHILHSAHQGVTRMVARAESSIFWPNITRDIEKTRANCAACNRIAPSQPSAPANELRYPEYPFQLICADFFSYQGKAYLIIVDRYSNWPVIERAADGSKGAIDCLRRIFATYGIPDELATDGGLEFTSHATQKFLSDWGVNHRRSSVAFPHSNARAEIGVKTAKRMLCNNISPNGGLNLDAFQRAMLTYRNTPDPDTGLSPAQCLFGRPVRDFIPIPRGKYKPHPTWVDMLDKRELALRNRHQRLQEVWSEHTKNLPLLRVGDCVRVQNQMGNNPLRWEKTGVIVEVRPHDQYVVKIDGSSRISLRNRKFLRRYEPVFPMRPKILIPDPGSSNTSDPQKHPNEMQEASPESTDARGRQERSKVPLALRRLAPHNLPGLTE